MFINLIVRSFNYTLTVSDTLYNSTATLSINVLDINDNSPEFIDPQDYIFNISENVLVPPPVDIGTVSAFDADSGTNKQVCYNTCVIAEYIVNLMIDICICI